MTGGREWTRAEAERVITAALDARIERRIAAHHMAWARGDGEKPPDPEPSVVAAVLDALGLVDTFTVVAGQLEQVGEWCPAAAAVFPPGHYVGDDCAHEPVYRAATTTTCPNCGGAGYTTESDHAPGCSGDEPRCAETCPVQVQERCRVCSPLPPMSRDEEPF